MTKCGGRGRGWGQGQVRRGVDVKEKMVFIFLISFKILNYSNN